MARAYVMDFAGGTSQQYDQVMEEMALGGVPPAGATWHYAGDGPTGWRVTDCWEDPDAFERFAAEQIMPLAAKAGLDRPEMLSFEVVMSYTGAAPRAELVQVVRLPGMDEAAFRAAHAEICPGGRYPDAIVHHVNGAYDGGWIVIDSWTTKAERDAFMASNIAPVMNAAGLSGPPEVDDLIVYGHMSAATAGAPA
jgi:hypothetical protein